MYGSQRPVSTNPIRRHTVILALTGTLAGAGVAILAWWAHGQGVEGLLMAARYTARLSFALFLMLFVARPLPGFLQAYWPLRERRGLGLAFAGAHAVHLAALVWVIAASGRPAAVVTVIFGGFGYVLLAAMALTSTDAAQRALGVWWHRLHRFGLYYLWFIFAVTYLRRILGRPDMAEYWILLGLAVAALAIRLLPLARPRVVAAA